MKPGNQRTIRELFADDELIDRALRQGLQAAIRKHRQARLPMAAWRDGKVVWISPEEIDVDGKSPNP